MKTFRRLISGNEKIVYKSMGLLMVLFIVIIPMNVATYATGTEKTETDARIMGTVDTNLEETNLADSVDADSTDTNLTDTYINDTEDVTIYLNNEKIEFDQEYGYPFIDKNSRTQVPFRIVLEKFGAIVSYNESKRIAIAQKGDVTVRVPIDEKYIYNNDAIVINDTKAIILNNRTYLPIRIVMEAFGCEVSWNGQERRVDIDYVEEIQLIASIPGYYDLRNTEMVSSIKDQGELGTCWAFAAVGALESSMMINGEVDLSEDHMSLTHGYDLPQTGGGDYSVIMAYLARWSGPVLEEDDPYGDGLTTIDLPVVRHVQESMLLPSKDYDAIKISVMYYGGVQSGIHIDSRILSENNEYYNQESNAYFYDGDEGRNHDILIVGWDDGYSKDNFIRKPEENGAFICKTSYGETFGEDGYFYISYEDVYIGSKNVVYSRVDSVDNYDNIYQTDWLGWVGRLGYGVDTAYFSNVYEKKLAEEELAAVSFYATDVDTTYEVYVVKEFQDKSDFKDMKLYKRGKLNYAGYYTIDLEDPIIVGDKFAVIIKIVTPDSLYPVVAEYSKDVYWLSEVNVSDGEGYMSIDGEEWDRTEIELKGNVALKAFTIIPEG